MACNAGYQSASGVCVKCGPRTFSSYNTSCIACPAGTFSAAGSTSNFSCINCTSCGFRIRYFYMQVFLRFGELLNLRIRSSVSSMFAGQYWQSMRPKNNLWIKLPSKFVCIKLILQSKLHRWVDGRQLPVCMSNRKAWRRLRGFL
jgi:hypothetical protein